MLFIEKCLPLADHSEYMVIDNHFNQRKLLSGCCCKFIHIHAETSVSGRFAVFVFKILCSPHLMLTDFRNNDGIALGHLIDLSIINGPVNPSFGMRQRIHILNPQYMEIHSS